MIVAQTCQVFDAAQLCGRHLMKTPAKPTIQPPQLPRHLPAGDIQTLEDHGDYSLLALAGCDFAHQAASGVLFEQVHFRRAAFTGTRLVRLRLADTRAEVCDLSGASWEKARLRRAEFAGCRLLGIQLLEAQLEDVVFRECVLEGAVFVSATFRAVRFEKCNLRGASFEEADLTGTVFAQCDLTNASLRDSKLHGADWRGSTLNGLQASARELEGVIIDPAQAVQVVGLLGITVLEEDE
jgi:uncharacterized protein YjbI with pentapeptide repeats